VNIVHLNLEPSRHAGLELQLLWSRHDYQLSRLGRLRAL
jgi:hypothetical protein